MPAVKLNHIVSFSSEDKIHKAENLLSGNSTSKWRCANPGEKQASVIIQLDKASMIKSIDIGNDGSAFVEVLVTRSTGDEVYKVLLVASSFMSLNESRSGSGSNRVRMFGSDKLCQDTIKEKWDRIKVICTQPFNKHATYGLHFINLHSPEELKTISNEASTLPGKNQCSSTDNKNTLGDKPRTSFGAFKLKSETEKKVSSVRSFSTKVDHNIDIEKLKRKITNKEKPVPEKKVKAESDTKHTIARFPTAPKPAPFQKDPTQPSSSAKMKASHQPQTEKPSRSKAKKFNELLFDVVFALSGYQNPARGDIRDKALAMGAQYRRDWTQDCTHLVCAFANTPKYHQVMGTNGKVVKAGWVYDCFKKKSKLPLKPYNLRPDYTSEDEDDESDSSDVDDPYDVSTDDNESPDTEDELEEALRSNNSMTSPQDGDDELYNASTDDETVEEADSVVPALPNHFSDCDFFLFGDFDDGVERMLRRHIVACDGTISNYMDDNVRYVITESSWQPAFDEAIAENSSLVFVSPIWVFKCGQERKLLPHHLYTISNP